MNFRETIKKKRLFFDGGMGTVLQEKGLAPGGLPEIWNIKNRDIIFDIHRDYINCGADIIKTNTFGANHLKLNSAGFSVEEVISAGIEIAKQAVLQSGREVFTALDIGPTGRLLAPFGDLDFGEAYDAFSEMIISGVQAGADIILIETMGDIYEIKAAMLAAKENSKLPLIVTFTLDENGKLLTGGDILPAVCLIEGLGADALGFNCGLGPEQMKKILPELIKYSSIPVVINPNAGIPILDNGKTVFGVSPEQFSLDMAELAHMGANITGGCCGTTPAHIKSMIEKCGKIDITLPSRKNFTAVSSYGKAVVFGKTPVIIGERINPTGKPKMKQALREDNIKYLYDEGISQIENGANILDVNVGLPEINESEILPKAVMGLQSITDIPLQIDTSDTGAMEKALRLYNGKPLLNSVNGKRESLDSVLPLVKKYGAAVVALTLDDTGIPETVEGRIEIAEKIIKEAEAYGIDKRDIILDALTLTISTGEDNAKITLNTVEKIKNDMGMHTVLGVSNVSFGLPEREHINTAFFTLAMSRGLSAAIINPLNPAMMNAFYSYKALSGADPGCIEYTERFSAKSNPEQRAGGKTGLNLYEAVVKGLKEQAEVIAEEMAMKTDAVDIINSHLVPALDKVGKGFEEYTIFLPQLLMSAEAAKAAFEAIKKHMKKQGITQEIKGRIVLATVKGDIHDIGKNIVRALLENYNFDVIDLGKNVEPEIIADKIVEENILLLGLSALMTTTVVNMEKTIQLVKEKAPFCKIVVGGAVLTKEYAEKIGADHYSPDAMDGVRYANEIFV